jgi:surface antigen
LVAATRGEEASYQNLVSQKNSEISGLRAQQRAANAALGGRVVAGDPNMGGYPNNLRGPKDSGVDPWGMFNRECVSYTAWKVYQKNGYMPYWGGRGNANQWPASAQADGVPTGSTPKVGSVAISMSGAYGHAMWVEQVNGNQIYVSQMNFDLAGSYSEMWVNGSNFTYLYF